MKLLRRLLAGQVAWLACAVMIEASSSSGPLWNKDFIGRVSSMVSTDNVGSGLILASEQSVVTRVSARTGDAEWRFPLPVQETLASVVPLNDASVLVLSKDGSIRQLSKKDGKVEAQWKLDAEEILPPSAVAKFAAVSVKKVEEAKQVRVAVALLQHKDDNTCRMHSFDAFLGLGTLASQVAASKFATKEVPCSTTTLSLTSGGLAYLADGVVTIDEDTRVAVDGADASSAMSFGDTVFLRGNDGFVAVSAEGDVTAVPSSASHTQRLACRNGVRECLQVGVDASARFGDWVRADEFLGTARHARFFETHAAVPGASGQDTMLGIAKNVIVWDDSGIVSLASVTSSGPSLQQVLLHMDGGVRDVLQVGDNLVVVTVNEAVEVDLNGNEVARFQCDGLEVVRSSDATVAVCRNGEVKVLHGATDLDLSHIVLAEVSKEEGTVSGTSLKSLSQKDTDWSMRFDESEKVLEVATVQSNSRLVSVLRRGSTPQEQEYKYVCDHLLVVSTGNVEDGAITVHIIDSVTGRLLHKILLENAVLDSTHPHALLLVDNVVLASYFDRQRKTYALSVIELLDADTSADSGELTLSAKKDAWTQVTPLTETVTYALDTPVTQLAHTVTRYGVSEKQVVATLPSGQHAVLNLIDTDTRRSSEQKEMQRLGLQPLASPVLSLSNPLSFVTRERVVAGASVHSTHAAVESTSLLLLTGARAQWLLTSTAPSGSFDVLPSDFAGVTLAAVCAAMLAAIMVTRSMADDKVLREHYETNKAD